MPYRIIVADKDPGARSTVSGLLKAGDNAFTEVSGSGELKRAIKDQRPDLIIINALLSDAPGWKIVPRIKESKDYADIPILLLTGDPGSPPPSELHSSGADAYLPKPIDGAALQGKVQSLLGLGGADLVTEEDSDIVIEFSDDDSGDMTEELLAMSSVALTEEELSPQVQTVGDTVEIDTAAPAEELDEPVGRPGGDVYEDTVRLNLDDMGTDMLDVEDEGFEPTIELVTDSSAAELDMETPLDQIGVEIDEPDITEPLPDFSSVTSNVSETQASLKDSVTVDMDVDDLGLELDTEGITEKSVTLSETSGIDPDDPEIGKLLEVQDPSMILTSEDLDLSDEYLEGDPTSQVDPEPVDIDEIDVIDLEDDTEIREVEIEELESIHASETASAGIDLDSAVDSDALDLDSDAVPETDIDEIAVPETDIDEIAVPETDIDEIIETAEEEPEPIPPLLEDDLTVDVEPTIEIAGPMELRPEELSLDDVTAEEMTTEEFFGEELPTEEFPTAKYPDDSTSEIEIEDEVALEGIDLKEDLSLEMEAPVADLLDEDISIEPEPATGEMELEEDISLEVEAPITAEPLDEEISIEPEPATGEIDLEEDLSLEIEAPIEDETPPTQVLVEPPAESEVYELGDEDEPMLEVTEDISFQEMGLEPPTEVLPSVESPAPEPTPAVAAVSAEAIEKLLPSLEEIRAIFHSVMAERMKEAVPEQAFSDSVGTAFIDRLPQKNEFSETFSRSVADAVPDAEHLVTAIIDQITPSVPSRDEIFARVDKIVAEALPTGEAIFERMDEMVKGVLPHSEAIERRVQEALTTVRLGDLVQASVDRALAALPTIESLNQRLDEALSAVPSRNELIQRLDSALESIPSRDEIEKRLEEALNAIPSRNEISERVAEALGAIPSTEEISKRLDDALEAIPSSNEISRRLDAALGAIPTRDEVSERIETALAAFPTDQVVFERLQESLDAFPSRDVVLGRLGRAILDVFPTPESIEGKISQALEAFPPKDDINRRLDRVLDEIPKRPEIIGRIDASLEAIPPQAVVLERMDKRFDTVMPEKDEFTGMLESILQQSVDQAMAELDPVVTFKEKLPSSEQIVSAMKAALPDRDTFRETLIQSITKSIQNSLPERMWLESVSRGLFDERTKGLLPDRDEVVTLLREEIRIKLLDTVERILKDQIEKITSEIYS